MKSEKPAPLKPRPEPAKLEVSHIPTQMAGESWRDFKLRRVAENKLIKAYLKGRWIWKSTVRVPNGYNYGTAIVPEMGTYRRKDLILAGLQPL